MLYHFQKIEKKWQRIWEKEEIYEPDLKRAKKPFYNLMMFPYPSAEGLHVGNMYAFVGSDIYGRFKRMQGYNVFEPIGLDGFGIHSENYALKIGAHPAKQAKISEKNFYKQLGRIGNGFAWNERLETYEPEYYRWTQWIFVQMFKNGLAYRKKQSVNWCPSCKTVLADEQVINGKCERCSSEVVKKELEQWFFKITKYADKLLKNLDKIDWSEKVKIAQKNWIGRSEGAEIKFKIQNSKFKINVFTTRPDTLFGATYMVLTPEHKIISDLKSQISNFDEVKKYIEQARKKSDLQRTDLAKDKTGVEIKGIKAINPANEKEIPIWIADYVLGSYGTGAIMAVPSHDKRDFEFAKKFNLPIVEVIEPKQGVDKEICGDVYEGEGIIKNSGRFNGMPSEKAKWEIAKLVNGKKKIQYRLRDWLISRQRYWGPPIPMIYCEKCAERIKNKKLGTKDNKLNKGEMENPGWFAVSEKDLPIKLPFVKDFRPKGTGESPLAADKSFYEIKCPKCGAKARRETDVSDTFLDSAWYYLMYPNVRIQNSKFKIQNLPFSNLIIRKWLPADMYIGGAEHAVLHLLYSRFIAMVFSDLGIIHFDEPFKKFRTHGLLIKEGAKMSKSKGNVVNPDEYIERFGADVFRMYLMFLAPFEQGGDFQAKGILGIARFLDRVFIFGNNFANRKAIKTQITIKAQTTNVFEEKKELKKIFNQTIKKITEDIECLNYNTAISALMILFNKMEKEGQVSITDYQLFLKLLAPFAPYLTEELYQQLKSSSHIKSSSFFHSRAKTSEGKQNLGLKTFKSIHLGLWPKYDPKLLKQEKSILIVQINGKFRDKIEVDIDISEQEAKKIILSLPKIQKWLQEKEIKKIIFKSGRLFNIVL